MAGEICHRFIPAPAGNRPPMPSAPVGPAVHPRACGEQTDPEQAYKYGRGSSPRLRGTECLVPRGPPVRRFIPAPAGNSRRTWDPTSSTPVHPRACGEQCSHSAGSSPSYGSSPRLRGTVLAHIELPESARFIPAPAGNRRAEAPPTCGRPVHPRACGEQTLRASPFR